MGGEKETYALLDEILLEDLADDGVAHDNAGCVAHPAAGQVSDIANISPKVAERDGRGS
jgi:hypothetical protein